MRHCGDLMKFGVELILIPLLNTSIAVCSTSVRSFGLAASALRCDEMNCVKQDVELQKKKCGEKVLGGLEIYTGK